MSDFSDVLKQRKELGLSQTAISKKLHIPLRTWESWEVGKRKPPEYVIELILYRLRDEKKAGE